MMPSLLTTSRAKEIWKFPSHWVFLDFTHFTCWFLLPCLSCWLIEILFFPVSIVSGWLCNSYFWKIIDGSRMKFFNERWKNWDIISCILLKFCALSSSCRFVVSSCISFRITFISFFITSRQSSSWFSSVIFWFWTGEDVEEGEARAFFECREVPWNFHFYESISVFGTTSTVCETFTVLPNATVFRRSAGWAGGAVLELFVVVERQDFFLWAATVAVTGTEARTCAACGGGTRWMTGLSESSTTRGWCDTSPRNLLITFNQIKFHKKTYQTALGSE